VLQVSSVEIKKKKEIKRKWRRPLCYWYSKIRYLLYDIDVVWYDNRAV